MNTLEKLQHWYLSQCNGDWEHGEGITISTLDNPGWSVSINLLETSLQIQSFEAVRMERSESDWITCRIKDGKFEIFCGPKNLNEALEIFFNWAYAR